MFSAMFMAVQQFCNMFIVLFGAGEKLAKAVDNVSSVVEKTSEIYSKEAGVKAEIREAELMEQIRKTREAIANGTHIASDAVVVPVKAAA